MGTHGGHMGKETVAVPKLCRLRSLINSCPTLFRRSAICCRVNMSSGRCGQPNVSSSPTVLPCGAWYTSIATCTVRAVQ